MSNVIKFPVIAGIEISTDDQGRFNLNALHKASGLGKAKQPNNWLRLDSTKELSDELLNSSDMRSTPIHSSTGSKGGTFAHELLAISYAGWVSPKFQLQVNQTFLDFKTGNLQLPQTLSEALRLAADLEDQKLLAQSERDEAIRTKAEIGSKREASAMAKASVETRRANKLQEQLGVSEEWKQTKAIPWLPEVFDLSRVAYQQIGKKLSALSKSLGINPKEIEDTNFGTVKAYHVDVINKFYEQLMSEVALLSKYRKRKEVA